MDRNEQKQMVRQLIADLLYCRRYVDSEFLARFLPLAHRFLELENAENDIRFAQLMVDMWPQIMQSQERIDRYVNRRN